MGRLGSKFLSLVQKMPLKWVTLVLVIGLVLVWAVILNLPDDKLHVSILDVGQGDAILIQTPGRQDVLIDGGPSPQAIALKLGKRLPFWDRKIDLVVLTQPQADHVTGLVSVLQRYQVKQAMAPGVTYNSAIYRQWLQLLEEKKIKCHTACSGQSIELGDGIRIEVLNPPSPLLHGTGDDVDNNGVVLRLNWNRVSFLFTADVGSGAERHIMAERANLRSTVLKVAHHGSRSSTSSEFLTVVSPQVAVISAGANNSFGHPHPEVLGRLGQHLGGNNVLQTAKCGTIEFITDGEKLWVKTESR